MPQDRRRIWVASQRYTLFIDEFEDFCSLTMLSILSKARKRHLALCITHQYIGQFDKEIADAIFANCGTLISFKVGVNDAPIMAAALDAPESELKDLPRGTAWIADQQRGQRSQPIPVQFSRANLPTGFLKANIERT
jgi:hypothetical protein